MADNTNAPSGDEKASAETTETGKYPADVQKAIDEANKRAEKAETERKKANEEAAAQRIRLKDIDEKKLADEGKLSELNGNLTKEREELQTKVKALEAENETAKSRLSEIETARRNELLAKLPEAKRETYKSVDLGLLEQISKDLGVVYSGNSQGSERGATANGHNGVSKKELPLVPFAGSDAPSIKILADILNN